MLLLICAFYRHLSSHDVRLINDCHNKSLRRDVTGVFGTLFRWLKRWSFRRVDLTLVSNPRLIEDAARLCPSVMPLRDPLPDVSTSPPIKLAAGHILFVCSFDTDEPLDLIFAAAVAVTEQTDFRCVITGDTSRIVIPATIARHSRISMPGHLPRREYEGLLRGAACVVSLTEDPDCLPCSAYEAISAERPLILSSTCLLREVFDGLATFVEHEPQQVASGVAGAATGDATVSPSVRKRFVASWQRELGAVTDEIEAITPRGLAASGREP